MTLFLHPYCPYCICTCFLLGKCGSDDHLQGHEEEFVEHLTDKIDPICSQLETILALLELLVTFDTINHGIVGEGMAEPGTGVKRGISLESLCSHKVQPP